MLPKFARAVLSGDTQQAVDVPAPPSCDFYSLGSVQWQPADQSQRTLGGREGRGRQEAGGRQRDRGKYIN